MLTLSGKSVFLRALEPEDLELLVAIENREEFWEISATQTPYSRFILKQYLENSHKDIYEIKQLRLVICLPDSNPLGFIDIFDFEPKHRRAAIGIIIANSENRKRGYAAEALEILCNYCFSRLGLHQVYAHVNSDNMASRNLFKKLNFIQAGRKKEWNLVNGVFKDEILFQLIKHVH